MAASSNPASNPSDLSKTAAKPVEVTRVAAPQADPGADHSTLTSEQQRALARIVAGRSLKSVARDVGVHRNTVSQWLNHDLEFRAAYNAWRLELEESARARIAGLIDPAINVLRRALARDNAGVAMALLKGQNLISPSLIRSSDPEEVCRQAAIDELERETALGEKENELSDRRSSVHRGRSFRYQKIDARREAAREARAKLKPPEGKKR